MSAYPVTHVRVLDTPPPLPEKVVIGVYRDISPRREEEPEDLVRLEEDESPVEAKVINPRRPRRPKPAEVAETK